MSEITEAIDLLLSERRPDRFKMVGGDEWLEEIEDEIGLLIPVDDSRRIAARLLVRRREGQKLRSGNQFLREMGETVQLTLDLVDGLRLPIRVGPEHIMLGAATPQDLRLFAAEERDRAATDAATRYRTCEAAELLADRMDSEHAATLADLRFESPDGE
jgi:hypothetical protein